MESMTPTDERDFLNKAALVVTDAAHMPKKLGFFYSERKAKKRNQPTAQRIEKWAYARTAWADFGIDCVAVVGMVDGVQHRHLYALCDDSDGDMNVEVAWDVETGWIADIHRDAVFRFMVPFLEQLTTRIAALYNEEERSQMRTLSTRVRVSGGVHKRCDYCDKPLVDVKRCARCQKVSYCDRECQRKHWKDHKKVCSSWATGTSGGV